MLSPPEVIQCCMDSLGNDSLITTITTFLSRGSRIIYPSYPHNMHTKSVKTQHLTWLSNVSCASPMRVHISVSYFFILCYNTSLIFKLIHLLDVYIFAFLQLMVNPYRFHLPPCLGYPLVTFPCRPSTRYNLKIVYY